MKQPTKCAICGGAFEEKTITYTARWGEDLYTFENVPALVCVQSGHEWFSAETSQRIDRAIQKQQKPKKYDKVPVFSFGDLAKA